jgi:hypothetical protein
VRERFANVGVPHARTALSRAASSIRRGRDLLSFRVVARRVRGQPALGLNRLQIVSGDRLQTVSWLFRRRFEKSVCSRRRSGVKPDNRICLFAGFLLDDRTRTRDLRRDRPVRAQRRPARSLSNGLTCRHVAPRRVVLSAWLRQSSCGEPSNSTSSKRRSIACGRSRPRPGSGSRRVRIYEELRIPEQGRELSGPCRGRKRAKARAPLVAAPSLCSGRGNGELLVAAGVGEIPVVERLGLRPAGRDRAVRVAEEPVACGPAGGVAAELCDHLRRAHAGARPC